MAKKAARSNHSNRYPPGTAGSLMTDKVPVARPTDLVERVREPLLAACKDFSSINYIYVVNSHRTLVGVISLRELLCSPADVLVSEVMHPEVVAARPHTEDHQVAALAVQHNLKAIPVVDRRQHFLGVVNSDTVLKILHQVHTEDLLRLGGLQEIDHGELDTTDLPLLQILRMRLPWLVIGLGGGLVAAKTVSLFEETLRQRLTLAMFMPVIVYMANAVGQQTQMLVIRNLAMGRELDKLRCLWREIETGFVLAFACAALLFLVGLVGWGSLGFALVLGWALFMAISVAVAISTGLPLVLDRLGKDPALGSGPFATIIQDVLSLLIYFTVASLLLGRI